MSGLNSEGAEYTVTESIDYRRFRPPCLTCPLQRLLINIHTDLTAPVSAVLG